MKAWPHHILFLEPYKTTLNQYNEGLKKYDNSTEI